jgi:hypothetical protein
MAPAVEAFDVVLGLEYAKAAGDIIAAHCAAARAEAERAKALNTRLIRELADKTTPPTDELTGLPL